MRSAHDLAPTAFLQGLCVPSSPTISARCNIWQSVCPAVVVHLIAGLALATSSSVRILKKQIRCAASSKAKSRYTPQKAKTVLCGLQLQAQNIPQRGWKTWDCHMLSTKTKGKIVCTITETLPASPMHISSSFMTITRVSQR